MGYQSQSPFRFVFWGLLLLFALAFLGPWLMKAAQFLPGIHGVRSIFPVPFVGAPFHYARSGLMFVFPFLLTLIYVVAVGTYVYRDASRRGMDPWLWTCIAVFVPAFVGLVIYLIARSNGGRACVNCGRSLRTDFRICPYCGHEQERRCPQCRRPIATDWKLCPHCGHSLTPAPASPPPGGGAG
ncbi:MAG: zinc-ribbon domain-containing protein [Candidatus Eisenbacteria bacterium]|nr:zinc-ribbon domain-containing protein [Candidatus Eisenbacteria bacterium]